MQRSKKSSRVPSILGILPGDIRESMVEKLIRLTLNQTKAQGLLVDNDLEQIHRRLRDGHHKLKDRLTQLVQLRDPWNSSTPVAPDALPIELIFDMCILDAYLLGSKSPDPSRKSKEMGRARIAKAMAARAGRWEEPVEEAIAQAFKTMDPDTPDKVIISYVRDEMKRLKIKLPVSKRDPESFLRRRIQPHRKMARYIAEPF